MLSSFGDRLLTAQSIPLPVPSALAQIDRQRWASQVGPPFISPVRFSRSFFPGMDLWRAALAFGLTAQHGLDMDRDSAAAATKSVRTTSHPDLTVLDPISVPEPPAAATAEAPLRRVRIRAVAAYMLSRLKTFTVLGYITLPRV